LAYCLALIFRKEQAVAADAAAAAAAAADDDDEVSNVITICVIEKYVI